MPRAKPTDDEEFYKHVERDDQFLFFEDEIEKEEQIKLRREKEKRESLKQKQQRFQDLIIEMKSKISDWRIEKKPRKFRNFLSYIAYRYASNQNVIIVVDGRQGTGKSSFCYQLASIIDPTFPPNVGLRKINTAAEFISKICYVLKYIKEFGENKFKGTVLVLDEARAGASGGSFASVQEFKEALDTMRKYQISLILNLPSRGRLGEELFWDQAHIWFRTSRADHITKKIFARVWIIAKLFTSTETFNIHCLKLMYNGEWKMRCNECGFAIPNYKTRIGKHIIVKCPRWIRGCQVKADFCSPEIWKTVEDDKDNYLLEKYKYSKLRVQNMKSFSTKNKIFADEKLFNDDPPLEDDEEEEDDDLELNGNEIFLRDF